MARKFNKNMFVMLFAIMIGAIIVTYFAADIVNKTKIDTLTSRYEGEITSVKGKSENFTSRFLRSSVILDLSREDRSFGNYHFDLAFLWYQSALSEKNSTIMDTYKLRGIDNCTNAMPYYYNSNLNFNEANKFFKETKNHTEVEKYLDMLDLYVKLTKSGSTLTMLRYNASQYLMFLTENLTFNFETNNVTYLTNVSQNLAAFLAAVSAYQEEVENYDEIQDEIDEYEFFDEER